ncbi:MAG: hypothetical protein QXT84_01560 [Candidatus Bathyarchaeia archaeon]
MMAGMSDNDCPEESNKYVTYEAYMKHIISLERRVSRLEIILYINLLITMVSLLKLLL